MKACFGLSNFSPRVTTGALVLVAVAALSGCQSMKRTLGIQKTVPDEFAVASPAPLSIPPDYNLRPPAPGEDRSQQLTAAEQARAALVGRARIQAYQTRGMSRGEATFLAHAGADEIQPEIRTTLDKEVSVFAGEEKTFTDKLEFWRAEPAVGVVIDPAAEAKRLSQNAATGKKPSDGPIPVISKGNTSFLGIF